MWQEQYDCSRWLKWPRKHQRFTLPAEILSLANSTLVSPKGATQIKSSIHTEALCHLRKNYKLKIIIVKIHVLK